MYMKNKEDNGVIRLSDKASIPNSEENRDWKVYLEWVSQGNVPIEWQENYGEET